MPFFQPAFSIQSLFVALSVLPWYLGWLEDILSFHMLDVPEWWPWFFVWAEPREKRPWMLNCMFSYHNICLHALPQVYFILPLTHTNQSLLKTCQTKKQMLQLLKIMSNIYSEPALGSKLCFFAIMSVMWFLAPYLIPVITDLLPSSTSRGSRDRDVSITLPSIRRPCTERRNELGQLKHYIQLYYSLLLFYLKLTFISVVRPWPFLMTILLRINYG